AAPAPGPVRSWLRRPWRPRDRSRGRWDRQPPHPRWSSRAPARRADRRRGWREEPPWRRGAPASFRSFGPDLLADQLLRQNHRADALVAEHVLHGTLGRALDLVRRLCAVDLRLAQLEH